MESTGCSSTSSGTSQPACAACKHQRKRCDENCVLAPYFPAHKAEEFLPVQKTFGVSNLTKMVRAVREDQRELLIESLIWEALWRQRDPVQGPYGAFVRQAQNKHPVNPNSMAGPALHRQQPLQRHQQPQTAGLPVPALAQRRYVNTSNVQNGNCKDVNRIIASNTSAANFTGGGIGVSSVSGPTYADDRGSSVTHPSLYGSMVHNNWQSWQIPNHLKTEVAMMDAVPSFACQRLKGISYFCYQPTPISSFPSQNQHS